MINHATNLERFRSAVRELDAVDADLRKLVNSINKSGHIVLARKVNNYREAVTTRSSETKETARQYEEYFLFSGSVMGPLACPSNE